MAIQLKIENNSNETAVVDANYGNVLILGPGEFVVVEADPNNTCLVRCPEPGELETGIRQQ